MTSYLIKNCIAVNEGKQIATDILLKNQRIEKIAPNISVDYDVVEVDGTGLYALPGVIDDQVHFREPGLKHKANIYTESKAAVAGGTTSFMEMPNTNPPAFTVDLLNDKFNIAKHTSLANHSFFMGTSNDNYEEIMKINKLKNEVCGVKIFMGSSTGNLLVDNPVYLNKIFAGCEVLIATHCEEEALINRNLENFKQHSMALTAESHPIIRDENVCYASSLKAIQLAQKNNTRLHILHISTAKELILFGNMVPLENKKITSEVCVHHLHFTSDDYANLGYQIKCNPAIKSGNNKEALWKALLDDRLDIIATDHAPHLLTEKGFDEKYGHGLVQVTDAYDCLVGTGCCGNVAATSQPTRGPTSGPTPTQPTRAPMTPTAKPVWTMPCKKDGNRCLKSRRCCSGVCGTNRRCVPVR